MIIERRILTKKFFLLPTLRVARELLGKYIIRKIGNKEYVAKIIEVEAYVGPYDRASHASKGKMLRTEVMFGPPGYWYIYLVYGMHHCCNIVTEKKNYPAAVLIRGIDADGNRVQGPGRVCRYLQIDRQFNNTVAARKNNLWIEDRGVKINPRELQRGMRIGVEYAGIWKEKLWRFYLE